MSTESKAWMALVAIMFVIVMVFASWRSAVNERLYLECLEANKVLLAADSERIQTHYCRY